MSPAARRLVTGKLVSGPSSIGISTPSPVYKSFSTPKHKTTPTVNLKIKSTPDRKSTPKIITAGANNNLTDDLLKIPPVRKSASDFF